MNPPQAIDGPRIARPAVHPPLPPPPNLPPALSTRDFVCRVVLFLLILVVFYVAWQGVHILLEAFAGVLFAVFLCSLATSVRKHTGLAYGWSLTIVTLTLVALVAGVGWLLANRLAMQVAELTQQLPKSFEQIQAYLGEYAWGRLLLQQVPKTTASLGEEMGGFSRLTGLVTGVASFLEAVVVILIVGIFGAAEPDVYRQGILHLVPPPNRDRATEALEAIAYNLRWWILGQVTLMVILAITTALGLWLIGVPLALVLGFITGVMELVPYIGAWLSALPAALMALLVGPTEVLLTLGLFCALHMLEGYVLVPLIQRRAVEMAPALTLVMQVLLGELLGILGLFVAAPLTVVLVVLVKMLYVEDALGDQSVEVPGEPCNEVEPAIPVREAT